LQLLNLAIIKKSIVYKMFFGFLIGLLSLTNASVDSKKLFNLML